jgi:hypothetical protein
LALRSFLFALALREIGGFDEREMGEERGRLLTLLMDAACHGRSAGVISLSLFLFFVGAAEEVEEEEGLEVGVFVG